MKNFAFSFLALILLFPFFPIHSKAKAPIRHQIQQIKGYNKIDGKADSIGAYCRLDGIVQSPNFLSPKQLYFSMFDSTGSIAVINYKSAFGYAPTSGDSVHVIGTICQDPTKGSGSHFALNALTYIRPDSIWLTSGSYTTHSPIVIGDTLHEKYESELVTIKNIYYRGIWPIDTTKSHRYWHEPNFVSYHGKTTIRMVVLPGMALFGAKEPPLNVKLNITGIVSQGHGVLSSPSPEWLDSDTYFIFPRDSNDIQKSITSDIKSEDAPKEGINIYPNPSSNIFHITLPGNLLQNKYFIEVTDIIGRKILASSLIYSDNYSLNAYDWPPGIYMVIIKNSSGNFFLNKIAKTGD